jgi:Zn-dependent M28 family amino/carboxypeptidase
MKLMILRRCLVASLLLLTSAGALCAAEPAVPAGVPDPLRDLARLRQGSNAARLEALQEILRERGLPFELQTFTAKESPPGRGKGTNVVMTFGAGEREITVGAHYDAVVWKDGGMSQGMVDNGAGAIVLLRVAEALKNRPLRHRIRAILFDQEEVGLLGSKAYVAGRKAGEITAAVNVDIAGFGDTVVYGLGKTEADARLQEVVGAICAERRLACLEFAKFPPGDERSFQAAGFPAVSLGFLPRLQAHQLWLFLNGGKESGLQEGWVPPILKIIHTPEDTLDKIDPGTLDLATGLVLETVLRLDGGME